MHKKINAILIPVLMAALLAAFIVMPVRDFSERENRYLAPAPALNLRTVTDGSFMEDIEEYVSDHFPFRDFWIGVNTRAARLRGKTLINGVYFSADDYLIEDYESSGNMSKIAKAVNAFAEKVKGQAKVTFMAVPTSVVINKDRLPAGTQSDADEQKADIEELYSGLECFTVPLADTLSASHYQSYYRLDHHWTTMAAQRGYEAYRRSCYSLWAALQSNTEEVANHPFESREYGYELVSDSFRGTLFNKVGECGLGSDSIYTPAGLDLEGVTCLDDSGREVPIFNYNKLFTADQYAYFLSGNHPVLTITNSYNEGAPDILVIKDSYANCMIPFMTLDYHTITVIDPRYYGDSISLYVTENGIEEVLFVYNMNTLGTDLGIRRVQ